MNEQIPRGSAATRIRDLEHEIAVLRLALQMLICDGEDEPDPAAPPALRLIKGGLAAFAGLPGLRWAWRAVEAHELATAWVAAGTAATVTAAVFAVMPPARQAPAPRRLPPQHQTARTSRRRQEPAWYYDDDDVVRHSVGASGSATPVPSPSRSVTPSPSPSRSPSRLLPAPRPSPTCLLYVAGICVKS